MKKTTPHPRIPEVALNAALAAAIFLINFLLNTPLFMRGDPPYRDSIEGGYAAMARFITTHPDPWGWNPLQYLGVPAQFMYLPGLPYLTAAVTWIMRSMPPEYVYRLLTATFVCLGPVTLFLFALYFTKNRWWALAAALGYTFFSPSYGLIPQIDKDRGGIAQLPWRVQVYVKYGEGPHNAGLTLLPLALIATWLAGAGRKYWQIFLAAVLMAAVTLVNWVAALALALCCLLLLAAASATTFDFRPKRVFAAAGLAWLLACFWLTPTFVRTILFNWPADSFGYHFRAPQAMLAAGMLLALFALWYLFARAAADFYLCFLNMAVLLFGWLVLAYYWGGIDTIPESRRYALEFEFFLMLALVEWLRRAAASGRRNLRRGAFAAAGVLVLLGAGQAWTYVSQDRHRRHPWPLDTTVEYRMASWLARQHITGRVFASGGLRFRLNAWFDVPQVGGGFESGLRNRAPLDLAYQLRTGSAGRPGRMVEDEILQLQAMGVQYLVIHGPKSREYYRDFANPNQFDGVLPVAFHIEDDTIYALPAPSLAHAVSPAELAKWHKPYNLAPYVAAIGEASRPKLKTEWYGTNTLTVEGNVPEGMVASVQVNYDPGWVARQNGREIPIESDALGLLVLRPLPGPAAHLELRYEGTLEQRLMAAVSALAWVCALAALWRLKSG